MNLRDLLLGIDVVGNVSIRGNLNADEGEADVYTDKEDDDEEYTDEMQVLEYSEDQQPVEALTLACRVKDLPPPVQFNSKKHECNAQGTEKKYPCRHCGERFSTNYMLGNHVSRKHRNLSKLFKQPKPIKLVPEGHVTRKRGRPRKYPVALSQQAISAIPLSNSNYFDARGKGNDNLTTHLSSVMEILREFENSPSEMRIGVFERSPLFASRLVALRALKQACDLGLITTIQYLTKQEEFLLSFAF